MKIEAHSPDDYVAKVPDDRRAAFEKLREVIKSNLPRDFEETMSYGMIGYVVPHRVYPAGYHCSPELPLPFMSIANQKNFLAFYHMGMYAQPELLEWFVNQYNSLGLRKLDMGKSCVRFKKPEEIPFELIGSLVQRMSADDWIKCYESNFLKKS